MHVQIKPFNDNFNVEFCKAEGEEAFFSIRGCRIMDSQKGPFVSFPAQAPKEKGGKWWQHCYASDSFAAHVLKLAQAVMQSQPKKEKPKQSSGGGSFNDFEDDLPF